MFRHRSVLCPSISIEADVRAAPVAYMFEEFFSLNKSFKDHEVRAMHARASVPSLTPLCRRPWAASTP